MVFQQIRMLHSYKKTQTVFAIIPEIFMFFSQLT